MPPPQLYPGLGTPIDPGLPFDVSPGTRAAGYEQLRQEMTGDVRRIPTLGQVLFGMPPLPGSPEAMSEQTKKMEQDYYSVPTDTGPNITPEIMAYNIQAMRKPNRLGPEASGRAIPTTPTDEQVRQVGLFRLANVLFPWFNPKTKTLGGPPTRSERSLPTFGMTPGGGPQKQMAGQVSREDESEAPTLETMVPQFGLKGMETPPQMPVGPGRYPMQTFRRRIRGDEYQNDLMPFLY